MEKDLENKILEFVQNRFKKGESTASRHIHIRFGMEIEDAEKILRLLSEKETISKNYDKEYQEIRYVPN